MARLFANNASAKLAAAINDTDNTLLLETGSGAKFPSPTGGDFFDLTLTQGTQETSWEIVKVTARVGDTLTIVRAQQGTTAAPWEAGDKAELRVTSGALDGKESAISAGTTAQYWRGDKTWRDFFSDVRAATLTGLSTATNAVVGAADTVLSAIGKLQKQVSDHFGATGSAHGNATTSVAGFMSSADKTKLDGVATNANNYSHPTGDGNLHVPATGTTNNGKVLTAGSTAGSLSWASPLALGSSVGSALASTGSAGTATTAAKSDHVHPFPTATDVGAAPSSHVGATGSAHGNATTSVAGFMSSTDKTKLDGIAAGATNYTHPASHPASIITQDANNRFVTDAEKTTWNAKQDALVSGTSIKTLNGTSVLGSGDITISSGRSGAVEVDVSAGDYTLTTSSPQFIKITKTHTSIYTYRAIVLPNASTLTAGSSVFVVKNTGVLSVQIKRHDWNVVGSVGPGQVVLVSLVDSATSYWDVVTVTENAIRAGDNYLIESSTVSELNILRKDASNYYVSYYDAVSQSICVKLISVSVYKVTVPTQTRGEITGTLTTHKLVLVGSNLVVVYVKNSTTIGLRWLSWTGSGFTISAEYTLAGSVQSITSLSAYNNTVLIGYTNINSWGYAVAAYIDTAAPSVTFGSVVSVTDASTASEMPLIRLASYTEYAAVYSASGWFRVRYLSLSGTNYTTITLGDTAQHAASQWSVSKIRGYNYGTGGMVLFSQSGVLKSVIVGNTGTVPYFASDVSLGLNWDSPSRAEVSAWDTSLPFVVYAATSGTRATRATVASGTTLNPAYFKEYDVSYLSCAAAGINSCLVAYQGGDGRLYLSFIYL